MNWKSIFLTTWSASMIINTGISMGTENANLAIIAGFQLLFSLVVLLVILLHHAILSMFFDE